MTLFSLDEIAALTDGVRHGDDLPVETVSTDSRTLTAGALFVALLGPNFDGHDYLKAAQAAGAAAALVQRTASIALPQVQVADPLRALGQLGAAWRQRFRLPVIALTGSNGKTSVKEMIAAILRQRGEVWATQGNLNNEIGVPLTLLGLRPHHQFAVIEMGANHCGEIGYLTALVQPDVGLITNAGPAHLEGFGGMDGVARGKGEIYQTLPPGATAVLNADDAYADYWREQIGERRCITFGIHQPAAISTNVNADPQEFTLRLRDKEVAVALPLHGHHHLYNALAAAAATSAVGSHADVIRDGLIQVTGVDGRLQQRLGRGGSRLIDDTYNANPASLRAALTVLPMAGARWLILGDMAELGAESAALHEAAGQAAQQAGCQRLWCLGHWSSHAAAAFGAGARHCTTLEQLLHELDHALGEAIEPPTILIKGSRSMRMERVVAFLMGGDETGSQKQC